MENKTIYSIGNPCPSFGNLYKKKCGVVLYPFQFSVFLNILYVRFCFDIKRVTRSRTLSQDRQCISEKKKDRKTHYAEKRDTAHYEPTKTLG
jgi:hypothetical protein